MLDEAMKIGSLWPTVVGILWAITIVQPRALAIDQAFVSRRAYDCTRLVDSASYRGFPLNLDRRGDGFQVFQTHWVADRT